MNIVDDSISQDIGSPLAHKTILRHFPQLRLLHGTPSYSVITNLCYFAQSHIESAWHPQHRAKALLFFQSAQIRISEMIRGADCQDMVNTLSILRSRIAAMEYLVKTVETSANAYNKTWKQAVDPLVQLFKTVRKRHQDEYDETDSVCEDCSTCAEASSDEDTVIESLEPSLIFSQSTDAESSSFTCSQGSEELKCDQEDVEIYAESSLTPRSPYTGQLLFQDTPKAVCKQEPDTPMEETSETTDDIEMNDEDTSSEYMPLDNESRASTVDLSDKEDHLFEPPPSRCSTTSSSKTSLIDPDSPAESTHNTSKYSPQTLYCLETMFFEVYSCRSKLSKNERHLIQRQTGLPPRSITYWFANHKRRYQRELQKYRRSGAESYAEYLEMNELKVTADPTIKKRSGDRR